MSAAQHQPAAAPEHGHGVHTEEDRVPTVRLLLVGLAALLIFFAGSFITALYERARERENGPIVVPPELGQNKIGLVEQQTFDLVSRGERQRTRQLAQLGSTGWVDRNAGIAHIPIEEAMRLVVEGVRPAPVQGGAPPPGGQP